MKIEAITFDVGGTLLEPWPSVGHVYAKVGQRHGLGPLDATAVNQAFGQVWKTRHTFPFDYTETSWKQLVHRVFEALTTAPLPPGFFEDLYQQFAQADAWRLTEDIQPLWHEWKRAGLKLGIISNWDDRLRPLLEQLDLVEALDAVIISAETKWTKPAPEIFQAAADRLGVRRESVLHVGDSRVEDFEGAQNAGCQAAWLRRGTPNLVWPHLSELAMLRQKSF